MLATPIRSNPIWHAKPEGPFILPNPPIPIRRTPLPHVPSWLTKLEQKYHVKPEGPFASPIGPINFWKKIHPNLSHPEPPWKILLPHVKIPPFDTDFKKLSILCHNGNLGKGVIGNLGGSIWI